MDQPIALVLCRKCEQYYNQPLGETHCVVCGAPVQLIDARDKSQRDKLR